MSTYLVAFVISDFTQKSVTVNNFIHRISAKPSSIGDVDFALDTSIKLLNILSKYLDTEFPLTKMDQIAVPDFHSGAMENWGLVTYRYNK